MGQERTRGPSPDDPEEQLTNLSRLIAEAAARATVDLKYQEAQKTPWQTTIWTYVLGGLILAAIVGVFAKLTTLENAVATSNANQTNQASQLSHLQSQVDWLIQRTK